MPPSSVGQVLRGRDGVAYGRREAGAGEGEESASDDGLGVAAEGVDDVIECDRGGRGGSDVEKFVGCGGVEGSILGDGESGRLQERGAAGKVGGVGEPRSVGAEFGDGSAEAIGLARRRGEEGRVQGQSEAGVKGYDRRAGRVDHE